MNAFATRGLLLIALLAMQTSVQAMETDQFYAWGKPIEDSADYLNAWLRLQVRDALESKPGDAPLSCEEAQHRVQKRMQHSIYHPIEIWAINSELVDKVPNGLEEFRVYRANYTLSKAFPIYIGRSLQPSPTIQANGVRFGTDKLAHFFSEGWWYYKWWRKHHDEYAPDEVERKMIRWGMKVEWWLLGMYVTGVVSMADLEANLQGFHFYYGLCHGDNPLLTQTDGAWTLSEQFDFRDYINPDWDESWNPNIYGEHRWKGVKPTMMTYCPMLQDPWVVKQRARYREHSTETLTRKLVAERVAAGKWPDPMRFDITTVCN